MYFWLIFKQPRISQCWVVTSNFSLPRWVFLLTLLLGLSWSMLLLHKNLCGKGPWEAFLMADSKKPAPISNNENLGVKPLLVQPVKGDHNLANTLPADLQRTYKNCLEFWPRENLWGNTKNHRCHETFNHPYKILYIFIFLQILFLTQLSFTKTSTHSEI